MELNVLVEKAKKGDGEAFVNIIKQYEGILYKVARRLLDNDEDVADAIQEAIMSAFENIHTLHHGEFFNTWMCKILINKCNSILNKNKKVICVEEVFLQTNSNDDFLKIELNDALNSLNKDYKLAILLYYIVGLNTKEIGEFISEPEGTVKSRISRAKAILREKYYKGEGVFENGK